MKAVVIKAAVSLATNVFNVRSRHGAVIFTDDKILGRGYNRKVKGVIQHTIHAERDALGHTYTADIKGDVYCLVIRLNKRGKLTNSMPCEDCQRALRIAGIKRIYYSVKGGDICQMDLNK